MIKVTPSELYASELYVNEKMCQCSFIYGSHFALTLDGHRVDSPQVEVDKMTQGEKRKPGRKPSELKLVTTTVRIEPRQRDALRRAALERARGKAEGRPDYSSIVRELLDRWIARGGK
jgi:hypothetical protein